MYILANSTMATAVVEGTEALAPEIETEGSKVAKAAEKEGPKIEKEAKTFGSKVKGLFGKASKAAVPVGVGMELQKSFDGDPSQQNNSSEKKSPPQKKQGGVEDQPQIIRAALIAAVTIVVLLILYTGVTTQSSFPFVAAGFTAAFLGGMALYEKSTEID